MLFKYISCGSNDGLNVVMSRRIDRKGHARLMFIKTDHHRYAL